MTNSGQDSRQDAGHEQPQENREQLYSFTRVPGAGLHGAPYRDFSASRRQVRAQFRYRVQWEQSRAKAKEQAPPQTEAPREQPAPGDRLKHAQDEAVAAGVVQSGDVQGGRAQGGQAPPTPSMPPAANAPDLSRHEPQGSERGGEKGSEQKSQEESAPEKQKEEPPGMTELDSEPLPQWFQLAPESKPRAARPARAQAAMGDAGARAQAEAGEAARWYALHRILPPESRSPASASPSRSGFAGERTVSALAVFSFAGGVGKTSLAATLGRALAAYGERVLLAETTPFGLLPFYFGSRDHKPGVVRVFSPPQGSPDLPVDLVSLEAALDWSFEPGPAAGEEGGQDPFLEELLRHGRSSNRILIDVQTASKATLRRLFPFDPTVLVPLLPDMNSIVSLDAVRAAFAVAENSGARPIEPVYLLNQFDASLPLHLDVREMLRRRLGDSLLPFVVRRSPAMSEALAEGMTVVDYRPDSSAAEDYFHLAGWLRSTTAAAAGFSGVRWSEQQPSPAAGE